MGKFLKGDISMPKKQAQSGDSETRQNRLGLASLNTGQLLKILLNVFLTFIKIQFLPQNNFILIKNSEFVLNVAFKHGPIYGWNHFFTPNYQKYQYQLQAL